MIKVWDCDSLVFLTYTKPYSKRIWWFMLKHVIVKLLNWKYKNWAQTGYLSYHNLGLILALRFWVLRATGKEFKFHSWEEGNIAVHSRKSSACPGSTWKTTFSKGVLSRQHCVMWRVKDQSNICVAINEHHILVHTATFQHELREHPRVVQWRHISEG